MEARVQLLEPGRRYLALPSAVAPRQQSRPSGTQQLVRESHNRQHDDQAGQGHEEGESHAPVSGPAGHTGRADGTADAPDPFRSEPDELARKATEGTEAASGRGVPQQMIIQAAGV